MLFHFNVFYKHCNKGLDAGVGLLIKNMLIESPKWVWAVLSHNLLMRHKMVEIGMLTECTTILSTVVNGMMVRNRVAVGLIRSAISP